MRAAGGAILGAAVAAAVVGHPDAANATGFFEAIGEALFGVHRAQPEVFVPRQSLDVTVRPRRTVSRPRAPEGPRRVVNTAIDPVKNPSWYLQDPTMRKGDVVVLDGEVLVFNGGHAPYTRADFSSLRESRLVSKPLRDRIRAMAGLMPDVPGTPVRRADVTARETPTVRE